LAPSFQPILFLKVFFGPAFVFDAGACFPPEHEKPSPVAAVTMAAFWINERRDELIAVFIFKIIKKILFARE